MRSSICKTRPIAGYCIARTLHAANSNNTTIYSVEECTGDNSTFRIKQLYVASLQPWGSIFQNHVSFRIQLRRRKRPEHVIQPARPLRLCSIDLQILSREIYQLHQMLRRSPAGGRVRYWERVIIQNQQKILLGTKSSRSSI